MRRLSLELQVPLIRPEVFPWESSAVEIRASVSSQKCCRGVVVTLPSIVDLNALLFPGGVGDEGLPKAPTSLEVEILGYDNGVTFELGTASITLPRAWLQQQQQQQQQQIEKSDHQFRVRLSGAAGTRTGMLAGNFQACSTSVDNAVGIQGPQPENASPPADILDKKAGDAVAGDAVVDKEAGNGAPGELFRNSSREDQEGQAIDMLEAAIQLLARPRDVSGDESIAACDAKEQKHSEDERTRRHTQENIPPDPWRGLDVNGVCDPEPPLTVESGGKKLLSPRFPTAGFRKFEPTTGRIEWHRIASVNVSRIEREGDLQTLKQFLPEVAVGNLDEGDIDANAGLITAFRLAQLQAQYVLHCQQVLQRQCDELQRAVTNMELETDGNLQGTTSLKNRSRILRKESRKQDKIINGYAAMLRTHNPVLASKVCLDEKGRLKVVRRNKVIPRRGHRRRGARKRRSRHSQESGTDGSPEGDGGGERVRIGSGCPLDSGSSGWSEVGGSVLRTDSPRPGGSVMVKAEEAFRDQADETRSQQEVPEARSTLAGRGESHVWDQGEVVHTNRGRSQSMQSRRRIGGDDRAGDRNEDRFCRAENESAGTPGVFVPHERGEHHGDTPIVSQVRLPGTVATEQELSRDGATGVLMSSTSKGQRLALNERETFDAYSVVSTPDQGRFKSHSPTERPVGTCNSASDGWTGAGFHASKGLWVKAGLEGRPEDDLTEDEQGAAAAVGHQEGPDRSSRLVTVTVKPKKADAKPSLALASPRQESRSASPQPQLDRRGGHERDVGLLGQDEVIKSSFSTVSLVTDVQRDNGEKKKFPAVGENAVLGDDKRTPWGRNSIRGSAGGGCRDDHPPATPTSLIVDASRLGLEGDEFPDVSEFELDDISEIDAGGELAGSEAGGSLSS